jgi:hypothetical protein
MSGEGGVVAGEGQGVAGTRARRMTGSGRVEKHHLLGFAIFLAILDIIVIGLAGNIMDRLFNGNAPGVNGVTFTFVIITLVAAMLTVAAIISGVTHSHHYSSGSVGSAYTTALIAWVATLLAFGFACKEIDMGNTGSREKALEAFVFILAFFETLYVFLLHAGLFNNKFGVGY